MRISIVVPAYEEAARLPQSLRTIAAWAEQSDLRCEIVVVDDGSRDGTAAAAEAFAASEAGAAVQMRVLINDGNRGKGYSVRRGMLEATGDLLLLSDADLSTPIEQVEKLLPWIEEGHAVAIGSRAMADSVLDPPQPWLRWTMGRIFGLMRRMIMLPDIRDTQCGFKLFTREAGRQVFALQQAEGFAFDCEVLGLARKLGYRIREVGVVWRDDRDSKVRPVRDSLAILWSLVQIRLRVAQVAARQAPPAHDKTAAR